MTTLNIQKMVTIPNHFPMWRQVSVPPLQLCESEKATKEEPVTVGIYGPSCHCGHKYRDLVLEVGVLTQG
jgi:hypothetical protein